MTRITRVEKQDVSVEIEISCDVCKRTDPVDDLEAGEYLSIAFTGGYGSVFGDGSQVHADVCQRCLKERLGSALTITPPAF